jgi:hypothetical protein
MASLLRAAARVAQGEHKAAAPSYVRRLLAAVDETGDSTPVRQGLAEPGQGLLEPLANANWTCFGFSGPTWTARTSPASSWCP